MNEKDMLKWLQEPETFAKNTLPPHSDHTNFAEEGKMANVLSLNGKWDFKYYTTPDAVDFRAVSKENRGLLDESIEVPGHLQLQGYGKPHYVNTQYPWDGSEKIKPPMVPQKFNPTGVYGRLFDLPGEFEGKRIRISFEGVESCFYLWVNGKFIGYHENSFCPAEFDLTDSLQEKDNYICVMVVRFCSGSWLEDQDFFRFSGIFRDVNLYGINEVHMEDLDVRAELNETLTQGNVKLRIRFDNLQKENRRFRVETVIRLKDSAEVAVSGTAEVLLDENGQAETELELMNPSLWSAENPALYECAVTVFDEENNWTAGAVTEFGFRKFEMKDGIMCLNGKRIVFRGVNRHEFHGRMGRAVTAKEIEEDILIIKRNNINAVRTSHYPNQKIFYKLCDRYGLYVIDETNLETHGTWQLPGGIADKENVLPCDNMLWEPAVLERGRAMLERDKNHPSILIWSCGNESYGGKVIRNLADWFRDRDASRLVHYEGVFWDRRYNETSDMESRMYAKPKDIREYLDAKPEKPFILCEYSHAMGNSCGGLNRYIALEDEYEQYQGGFIWDFADQALLKESEEGKPFWASGGQFDDRPTDGYFSGNGLCFADHTLTPKMEEVKFLYQPVTITFEDDDMYIRNKNLFASTENYEFRWKLMEDGITIKQGSFEKTVAPLSVEACRIPVDKVEFTSRTGEIMFQCSVHLNGDTMWAEKGFEIGFGQHILRPSKEKQADFAPAELVEGDFNVGIRMKDSFALLSKADGRLISIQRDGEEYLNAPLKPDFWRAPVDNDAANDNTFRWAQWKLASLYQKCVDIQVDENGGSIRTKFKLATNPVTYCCVNYHCFYDNKIQVSLLLEGAEGEIPAVGFTCKLKKKFDHLQWYGNCQKEAGIDRRSGSRIELCESRVGDQYVPYLNPQENANKTDLRYFTVKTEDGKGIRVSGEVSFEATALPYTSHEIENAENIVCLPNSQNTVLSMYGGKSGVGGDDSWGAPVEDDCILKAAQAGEFTIYMEIL